LSLKQNDDIRLTQKPIVLILKVCGSIPSPGSPTCCL